MYNPYAEEIRRQREQLAAMGIQPESSGMTPGMGQAGAIDPTLLARAGVDTSTQKAKLARQGKYADMLRGREMPKGREVGPLGVYMGPNWGETLAGAMNPVIAGVMDRSMEDDYANLSAAEADKNMAGLELEDARRMAGQAFKTGEREAGQAYETAEAVIDRGLRQSIANMNDETSRRGQGMTAETARLGRENTAAGRSGVESWQGPDGTINVVEQDGKLYHHDPTAPDQRGAPADVTGMIPLDTTATGSTSAVNSLANKRLFAQYQDQLGDENAIRDYDIWVRKQETEAAMAQSLKEQEQAEADALAAEASAAEADEKASGIQYISNILMDPLLEQGTGYNFDALVGKFGQGPEGPAIQDLQRRLKSDQLGGLIPAIAEADLTPVSDTDVKKLEAKFVDAMNQPYGIIGFHATETRRELNQRFDQAIKDGSKTPGQKAEYIKALDASLIRSAEVHGYPDEQLIRNGVDPEYIEFIRLTDKQRKGG